MYVKGNEMNSVFTETAALQEGIEQDQLLFNVR